MIDKPHYMSVLTFRNYVFHFYDVNICKKGNYCPKCGVEMESEKNESGNS